MIELILAGTGCLFLGVIATLHPCPVASNIAAVSFLSGWALGKKGKILIYIYFISGYTLSLFGLSMALNAGILHIPDLSLFLQTVMSSLLGPLFVLAGMIMTGLISIRLWSYNFGLTRNFGLKRSLGFAFPVGALTALAFCPATASVYFGILLPLSIKYDQVIVFPALYAIGASFPLVALSFLINHSLVNTFKNKYSKKVSHIAGYVLIVVGVYLIAVQLLH